MVILEKKLQFFERNVIGRSYPDLLWLIPLNLTYPVYHEMSFIYNLAKIFSNILIKIEME